MPLGCSVNKYLILAHGEDIYAKEFGVLPHDVQISIDDSYRTCIIPNSIVELRRSPRNQP
jgi:hypothetical protein